ncbi:hypothetical protein BDZ89DRAFT_1136990 [Hymenopellis radicata]|nr:hypothetical protein BDZ89DRAFT_1136990 [Hymenopellis radicata]
MKYYSREVKNALWRKPGEKPAELPDVHALLRHAGLGGLRSAVLGSSLHALVNLLLLLIRRKKPQLALVFSRDVLRFGASLGAFTALYRVLIKATRHAFFSGAAAGTLAIILSPNTTLSQQLLMRGVQGSSRRGASTQIPSSCFPWPARKSCTRTSVPRTPFHPHTDRRDEAAMNKLLDRKGKWECTAENRTLLSAWKEGPVPCTAFHPDHDRCWTVPPPRLVDGARFMLPIYAALHILPTLFLRPATFVKHPTRVPLGIARSCAFFGLYVYVNQIGICLRSAGAPIGYWFPGLASGIALGVEAPEDDWSSRFTSFPRRWRVPGYVLVCPEHGWVR